MHLEFLRLEDNIEVFLNKKTGQEVYAARTSTPVDALFTVASEIVRKHLVAAGEPPLSGSAATDVAKAAGMLEKVLAEAPRWWNAQWFYGKSQMALGRYEAAYQAFRLAYEQVNHVEGRGNSQPATWVGTLVRLLHSSLQQNDRTTV